MHLLFDIGGTKTRVAVVNSKNDKKIKKDKYRIFPTPKIFSEGIDFILSVSKILEPSFNFKSAVGSIGGVLNSDKSILANHANKPNLLDWENKHLKESLHKKLGCPVSLENDAAFGALGEAKFGAGKGYEIVAYITIGTGIGGARIVNGSIDENSLGFEPGKQIIDADGSIFPKMKPPITLEDILGGLSIQRRKKMIPTEIEDPAFWKEMTNYLAIGLNDTIVHWSPDVVVLGGSISREFNPEILSKQLKKILTTYPKLPTIKNNQLEDLAGLYGSLAYLQ